MSIYKLRNTSGVESSAQEWANGKIFPNGINIDLLHHSDDVGLSAEDIIGVLGGDVFCEIRDKIVNEGWKLNNGIRDYYYDEALYLLTNGTLAGFQLKGEAKTIVTHDLCHKSTWYQGATQVTDESLVKVNNVYRTKNMNLICLRRGFMYQEDKISFQENFNIKVNGNIVEDSAKFTVEPISGTIKFIEGFIENPETDTITCSYEYGASSTFEIKTDNDHLWRILKTEIQLDSSMVLDSPICMEVIIDHPVAGDNYMVSQWVYKSVRDFISGSNLGFSVPSFGGTKQEAGYEGDIIILPFDYTNPLDLPVGMNTRIRLRTKEDICPNGNFATVTFYMDKIKL